MSLSEAQSNSQIIRGDFLRKITFFLNHKSLTLAPIWFPHWPACRCTISLILAVLSFGQNKSKDRRLKMAGRFFQGKKSTQHLTQIWADHCSSKKMDPFGFRDTAVQLRRRNGLDWAGSTSRSSILYSVCWGHEDDVRKPGGTTESPGVFLDARTMLQSSNFHATTTLREGEDFQECPWWWVLGNIWIFHIKRPAKL